MGRLVIRGHANFKGVKWSALDRLSKTGSTDPIIPPVTYPDLPDEGIHYRFENNSLDENGTYHGTLVNGSYGTGIDSPPTTTYFSHDFENDTYDTYLMSEIERDWFSDVALEDTPVGIDGSGNNYTNIVDWDSSKSQRATLPHGTTQPIYSGFNFFSFFDGDQSEQLEEVYFSYNISVQSGFQTLQPIELPGIIANPYRHFGGVSDDEGSLFSPIYSSSDGNLQLKWGNWNWYPGDPNPEYGPWDYLYPDGPDWTGSIPADGTWHNITIRAVHSTPGEYDGLVEGYIDGILTEKLPNLCTRLTGSIYWDMINWKCYNIARHPFDSPTLYYMYFDDPTMFMYDNVSSMPTGSETSSDGRILYLPNYPRDVPILSGSVIEGDYELDLTANDSYMSIPGLNYGNIFTVTGWHRNSSDVEGVHNIFSFMRDNDGLDFYLDVTTKKWVLKTGYGSKVDFGITTTNEDLFTSGSHTHWAFAVNRNTGESKIWINGQDETLLSNIITSFNNTGSAQLGCDYNLDYDLDGYLDDVQIYKSFLFDNDVEWIYNNPGTMTTQSEEPVPPPEATGSGEMFIILDIDFKGNTSGANHGLGTEGYLTTELQQDFLTPSNIENSITYMQDISDTEGTSSRALMTAIPTTPTLTGNQWITSFTSSYDELYLSYNFMWDENWEVQNGGKMPGLSGANRDDTDWGPYGGSGTDIEFGFSARMDWGTSVNDGNFNVYLYHHDQVGLYGEHLLTGIQLETGDYNRNEWHNVTQRIVENTINSESVGNNDGILEVFWDGVLVYQKDDLRLRNYSNMSINRLFHDHFFGGSGDPTSPTQEVKSYMDDYLVFYYSGSNVTSSLPIGNVSSEVGRTLELPNWPRHSDIMEPFAWYRMENDATDSTGSNDGTLVSLATFDYSTPMIGNYELNTTSGGKIQLPEINMGLEFTICGWFRKDTTSTNLFSIFSMEDENGIGLEIYLDQQYGQWCMDTFPYNVNSSRSVRSNTGLFSTGSTYHWAFSGNLASGDGKVWINGVNKTNVKQVLWSDTDTPMLGSPIIGDTFGNTYNGITTYPSDGYIDDVQIYKNFLSDSDIQYLYNNQGAMVDGEIPEPGPLTGDKETVWSHSFSSNVIEDPYTYAHIQDDWLWETHWPEGRNSYVSSYFETNDPVIDHVSIVDFDGSRCMKHHYESGSWGVGSEWNNPTIGGGINLFSVLTDSGGWDELYLSYNIYFPDGFDWASGGKMPGFVAIPMDGDLTNPLSTEGTMALCMWQDDGEMIMYSYWHKDYEYTHGLAYGLGPTFTTGQWYNVTMRLVMSSTDSTNGIQEVFIDGILVGTWNNNKMKEISNIWINTISFNTFMGGNDQSYAPSASQDLYIDDVDVWYISGTGSVDHPVGRTVSPSGRDITTYITQK